MVAQKVQRFVAHHRVMSRTGVCGVRVEDGSGEVKLDLKQIHTNLKLHPSR